jgi:hypothetical protein
MRYPSFFQLVAIIITSVSFVASASAMPIIGHSDVFATREISIQNTSLTEPANVTFTFSGQVTAIATTTGDAVASVSSFVRFDRIDVPELLLSNSVSAPPSHTGVFPATSFNFDIAPGGAVLLSSVGSIATDVTIPSPSDDTTAFTSATALGTGVDSEDFTNNSSVPVQVNVAKRVRESSATLSFSGLNDTLFTGIASFSVPGFTFQLTSDGVNTLPLETTFTATVEPGQTVNSLHTSTNKVTVTAVPEPSTSALLGVSLVGWVSYRFLLRSRRERAWRQDSAILLHAS